MCRNELLNPINQSLNFSITNGSKVDLFFSSPLSPRFGGEPDARFAAAFEDDELGLEENSP